MKKVVFASVLAIASSALCLPPLLLAQDQGSQSSQITIKDPAEYNAYTSAIGQSTPAAKAAAIESFSAAISQQRSEGGNAGAAGGRLSGNRRYCQDL